MKKDLLKTPNGICGYIYNGCYMMGMGEKPRNIQKTNAKIKEKFPVWLPTHSPVYEMEADCFPVSENIENKPNLPWVGEVS